MTPVHLLVLSSNNALLDSKSSEALIQTQAYAKYFSHATVLVFNYGQKQQSKHFDKLDIIPVNAWGKFDLLIRAFLRAKKIYNTKPFQLITSEDPRVPARVGKWLKSKLHIPLNIQMNSSPPIGIWEKYLTKDNRKAANATIAPITPNLNDFYKPAHFRPAIKKFISIGDLTSDYNNTDLINGFAQITHAYPETKLTIIGDGPDKNMLASQIVNLGLNDRIFILASKTIREIAALLHQHDVFVFTGHSVGWGERICQAQASGLPIITTPTQDGEELLQPNTNCLVASSTQHFTLHTSHLIQHPEDAYRFAKNGQQWLAAHLESEVLPKYFARQLIQIIEITNKVQ